MGRWAEKYTPEQREAVGCTMVDNDPLLGRPLYAREAVERLNAGRLNVPAPVEPMPVQSAYDYRDNELRRRQGQALSPLAKQAFDDPETVNRKLVEQIVSVQEHNVGKLVKQQAKGDVDPRLFAMVVKNQREIAAMLRVPSTRRPNAVKADRSRIEEDPTPDVVGGLLEAHRATARGEPRLGLDRRSTQGAAATQDPQHTSPAPQHQAPTRTSSVRSANGDGANSQQRSEASRLADHHV